MKIFIPLSDGFEELEVIAVIDILRRAGITIDLVGVPMTSIIGRNGIRLATDKRLNEIKIEEYDGIVLSGGGKNVENLMRSSIIIQAIQKLNSRGKLVAAICAAPKLLAKAGVLEKKRATIYPGLEKELPYPRDGRVIVDGNIITSQGPGTALEFALKIVEILLGQDKTEKLKKEIVF
jgi:4-methyl-5(b-hydroxyethyl)-thiazole monophosphate biosynthesis